MISTVLISSIMFQQVTSISFLEVLLHQQITESQCEVRCRGLETREEVVTCLEVCREVVTNPESSLCTFTQICTGACRAACGHQDNTEEDNVIKTVEQRQCSLSWSTINNHQSQVRFIVAGLDQGGMINLITSNTRDTSIIMTSQMMDKYLEMTVIAVGSDGVVDIKSSYIQPEEECSAEIKDEELTEDAAEYTSEDITDYTTEDVTKVTEQDVTEATEVIEVSEVVITQSTSDDNVVSSVSTDHDNVMLTTLLATVLATVSALVTVLIMLMVYRHCLSNSSHHLIKTIDV